ncbi:MAG: hypothetical protein EOM90_19620 [Alphaproteobacteria bacterium]|nr:hypothetical protein [Alphaproteobacteria bacterium]
MMCLHENHRPILEFNDDTIISGVIPVSPEYQDSVYWGQEGLHVWLEGEITNAEALGRFPFEKKHPAALLHGIFSRDNCNNELAQLCGFFSSVIYDANRGKLHFMSGRFGLRHLFLYFRPDRLFWCAQQKGFLAIPDFNSTLKSESIRKFLEYNYLPGDSTWFQDVILVPPASVITVDLLSGSMTSRRYWDWRRIEPSLQLDEDELVDRMHDAFQSGTDECIFRVFKVLFERTA